MNIYELAKVETPDDWERYHAIRRKVLFEARGQYDYDPNGPDERKPENLSLLLRLDGVAIGTVRLDMRGDNVAVVRLVAIDAGLQRSGHGSVLLQRVEDLARSLDVRELRVHAAPEATGFYEKHGYSRGVFEPESRARNIKLRKSI